MVTKMRFNVVQWLMVLTPVLIMVFCGLVGYSVAQTNRLIDGKASKEKVEGLCTLIEKKVDNATLLEMLSTLRQKDRFLAEENDKQNKRIDHQGLIQIEQLKVLGEIKVEMEKMNGKIKD